MARNVLAPVPSPTRRIDPLSGIMTLILSYLHMCRVLDQWQSFSNPGLCPLHRPVFKQISLAWSLVLCITVIHMGSESVGWAFFCGGNDRAGAGTGGGVGGAWQGAGARLGVRSRRRGRRRQWQR